MGMKGLSEYYREDSIQQDTIRGITFLIIVVIPIAVLVPFSAITGVFSAFAFGFFGVGFGFIVFFAMIAVIFVFYLLAAINLRRAFNSLAQKSGENMFETAGTLVFWRDIYSPPCGILVDLSGLDNCNNSFLLYQSSPTTIRI